MKLLFENWRQYLKEEEERNVLNEAAKTIDDVDFIRIEPGYEGDGVVINLYLGSPENLLSDDEEEKEQELCREICWDEHPQGGAPWHECWEKCTDWERPEVRGTITITPFDNCKGSYFASSAAAVHGYGPLMADIAIEYVQFFLKGKGLTSHSLHGSGFDTAAARQMWEHYDTQRTDIVGVSFKEYGCETKWVVGDPYEELPEYLTKVYRFKESSHVGAKLYALEKEGRIYK